MQPLDSVLLTSKIVKFLTKIRRGLGFQPDDARRCTPMTGGKPIPLTVLVVVADRFFAGAGTQCAPQSIGTTGTFFQ